MNQQPNLSIVTIDGPAASGKTSVSRELARRLNWKWVSTGAFYRGLAYVAQELKINLKDEMLLANLVHHNNWYVEMSDENTKVYFQKQDVTHHIFAEEVGNLASMISAFPRVRAELLAAQRTCFEDSKKQNKGLVAEGRDCGSVVFPEAKAKIYLTAKFENRAERRSKDQGQSIESLVQAQKKRDDQDSNRKIAPLMAPKDSYIIDTTNLTFNEVVDLVEKYTREKLKD